MSPLSTSIEDSGVIDPQASELEAVLREISAHYATLARCAAGRREAMRRADTPAMARWIDAENLAVQAIADLERRRMNVVEALAARINAPARSQTPVRQLAGALPEPFRTRVLSVAQSLRESMENLAALNETTKRAAETLATHMEGLLRHVAAKMNHAQTYGPRGVVSSGPRVVSAWDATG